MVSMILYCRLLINNAWGLWCFALLGGLVVDFGASAELFQALGVYSVTVIGGLLLMIFGVSFVFESVY